jgi:hypothetical protein
MRRYVEMDLYEKQCEGVKGIHLSQDGVWWKAVVNMIMNVISSSHDNKH